MKTTFSVLILVTAGFVTALLVHGSDNNTTTKLKVIESKSPLGTRWLQVGPGVLNTMRSCRLSRLAWDGNGRLEAEAVNVNTNNVEKVRRWSQELIEPLLNMKPKDDGMYAEEPRFVLDYFAGTNCETNTLLLTVPLASVFESFSEKDYATLVKSWCSN